jgi:hypothetical protein
MPAPVHESPVFDNALRKLPPKLAASVNRWWIRRGYGEWLDQVVQPPLVKGNHYSLTPDRGMVAVQTSYPAGIYAVHRDGAKWVVDHVPTGRALYAGSDRTNAVSLAIDLQYSYPNFLANATWQIDDKAFKSGAYRHVARFITNRTKRYDE